MKKIAIAGCGWLGSQIAEHFEKQGFPVYASYRRQEHALELKNKRLNPFSLLIDQNAGINTIDPDVRDATLLILSLPPMNRDQADFYALALTGIAGQFSAATRVIMISSTGVYPQKDGAYDEAFSFQEVTTNPILLAEQRLRKHLDERLCIIRSGGLIGPGRHPVFQLSGKFIQTDGSAPVSLIHSLDLIHLIELLADSTDLPEIINAVYPIGMSKKEYYSLIAKERGLALPVYGKGSEHSRTILPSWMTSVNFKFQKKLYLG